MRDRWQMRSICNAHGMQPARRIRDRCTTRIFIFLRVAILKLPAEIDGTGKNFSPKTFRTPLPKIKKKKEM
jgi:hypothetical protein